jgi:mannose-6-phosphate isomerase-like protein (cupin superfamily)
VDDGQTNPNLIHTRLKALIDRNGTSSNWSEIAISDNRNFATYTHEMPRESSGVKSHSDEDRWWVVLQGNIRWSVEGEESFRADSGDVVFIEKDTSYSMGTVGESPSIRVTVRAPVI